MMDKSIPTIVKMFDKISRHYDFMNDLMTGFSHRKTRKKALRLVPIISNSRILDLATGTGDFALLVHTSSWKPKMTVGVDISPKMLSIAKSRTNKRKFANNINFNLSDMNNLPFRERVFNLCTIGYGIRNTDNPLRVLTEIRRVTAKSGYLLIVEATTSDNHLVRILSEFYFQKIVPTIAKILHLDTKAYSYLGLSIATFPPQKKFELLLKQAGWKKLSIYSMYIGTVSIFLAQI
jgi:demethylmenaquinone methyltransferase/2-methoxy-6-polyprenyl-1,4-benzoquinol methylase